MSLIHVKGKHRAVLIPPNQLFHAKRHIYLRSLLASISLIVAQILISEKHCVFQRPIKPREYLSKTNQNAYPYLTPPNYSFSNTRITNSLLGFKVSCLA